MPGIHGRPRDRNRKRKRGRFSNAWSKSGPAFTLCLQYGWIPEGEGILEGQIQVYVPLDAVHAAGVGILPQIKMVVKIRHGVVFRQPQLVVRQFPQVVMEIALDRKSVV